MSTSKRLLISANNNINNNNHLSNKISLSLPPAPAPFIDDQPEHAVTVNGGGIKTYISVHNGEDRNIE